MSNRKHVTDEDILADKKASNYFREKCLNNIVHWSLISFIIVGVLMSLCFVIRAGLIYSNYIEDPASVNITSIDTINSILTHAGAALGGYVATIVKRATGV